MARPIADKPKGTARNEHTGAFMRTKESKEYRAKFDEIDWSYIKDKVKEKGEKVP